MSLLLEVSLIMLFGSFSILIVCFIVDTSSVHEDYRDWARTIGFIAFKVMLGSIVGITVDLTTSLFLL